VVPELSLQAGYQIAPGWRLTAGYDVMYWTGVQRAGGLIDTTVNPNLTPPAAQTGPRRCSTRRTWSRRDSASACGIIIEADEASSRRRKLLRNFVASSRHDGGEATLHHLMIGTRLSASRTCATAKVAGDP
jgi:Putative beta barrel porin-7 (BBP7)